MLPEEEDWIAFDAGPVRAAVIDNFGVSARGKRHRWLSTVLAGDQPLALCTIDSL
jgi:hypothetical protein